MAPVLTFLTCIGEVPVFILGSDTGYLDPLAMVFFSSSRHIPGEYPKLGYERFLPHPFHFISH
jgi:hypothetical protein